MIKKWILNNFKSINQEKELEFRPLTIFTGANSSGKSTILQSILLVTQTLQNQVSSNSIVLNGWFKKFGTYDDVVYKRDNNRHIKIGFSLDNEQDIQGLYARRRFGNMTALSHIDCDFEISAQTEECLHPELEHMKMSSFSQKEKTGMLHVYKCLSRNEQEKSVIETSKKKIQPLELKYTIDDSEIKTRLSYYDRRLPWHYFGAGMFHFIPNYLVAYCSYKDYIRTKLIEYLFGGGDAYYSFEEKDRKLVISVIQDKGLDIVDDIYKNEKFRDKETFIKYYNQLKNNNFTLPRFRYVIRVSALDADDIQKYSTLLSSQLELLPSNYIIERIPLFYQPGIEYLRSFFCEKIQYLGPLREEPKALYPLESNGDSSGLGLKGENTAAVYENNKGKIISYIDPSYYDRASANFKKPILKEGPLAEAINKWLVYLGVAKDMSTNDRGKFGHELKITTDIKDMKQDLTHVGVGVSQILPILVLCFLAEKGNTIILEQPELHLHPKVQTRLADFFVSMNVLGKQCIIETHSEYLINRLRLIVAKSEDTQVSDDTMIYFVEKDKETGASTYRKITINPYGKIDHWPEGFFDEGEDLSSQIVEAAFEKKRKEKLIEK